MNMSYPLNINDQGRTVIATDAQYIRQLIEQLLFTSPGERVNRPDFGSGLMQMVFSPAGDELVLANQFMIQASLQQWLGELIQVEAVEVNNQESRLTIIVQYVVVQTQEQRSETFDIEVS